MCCECWEEHKGHITMPLEGFMEEVGNCREDETMQYLTRTYREQLGRMRKSC